MIDWDRQKRSGCCWNNCRCWQGCFCCCGNNCCCLGSCWCWACGCSCWYIMALPNWTQNRMMQLFASTFKVARTVARRRICVKVEVTIVRHDMFEGTLFISTINSTSLHFCRIWFLAISNVISSLFWTSFAKNNMISLNLRIKNQIILLLLCFPYIEKKLWKIFNTKIKAYYIVPGCLFARSKPACCGAWRSDGCRWNRSCCVCYACIHCRTHWCLWSDACVRCCEGWRRLLVQGSFLKIWKYN